MRKILLYTGLTFLYLFLVAPLGWLAKLKGARPLSWKGNSTAGEWIPIRIDAADKEIYGNEEMISEIPGKRLTRWGLFPLSKLASPPKEAELSSDLYVLF